MQSNRSLNHVILSNQAGAFSKVKSTGNRKVLPGVLFVAPFQMSKGDIFEKTGRLCELLREKEGQAEIFSYVDLNLPLAFKPFRDNSVWVFIRKGLIAIKFLKKLITRITSFDLLHIIYSPETPFLLQIIPVMFLGKFFGKKVVLDYRNIDCFTKLNRDNHLIKKCLRLSDGVLVSSDYQLQLVDNLKGKGRYISESIEADKIKAKLVKTIQPNILASVVSEKSSVLQFVLRAYKLVKQKYPRTEMLIIGTDAQLKMYEYLINKGKIHGVTFKADLNQQERQNWLKKADIYVNYSKVDCLSKSLLEALAFGLPVISTLTGVVDTFINRQNILFVKHGDHNGIAERIIELVENPPLVEKLSRQGRIVAEGYSWKKIKQQWFKFYADLNCY